MSRDEIQKLLGGYASNTLSEAERSALMEAALVLATIAQRFRFTLMPGREVTPLASLTLRPRHGLHVEAHSRMRSRKRTCVSAV